MERARATYCMDGSGCGIWNDDGTDDEMDDDMDDNFEWGSLERFTFMLERVTHNG